MAESAGPSTSDDDAVTELHRELSDQLKRLAWAMLRDWALADDAVQEAFLLLAAKCHEVPSEQRRGWLVITVQFSALNLRRRRERQGRLEKMQLLREPLSEYACSPSHPIELTEELDRVRDAVAELPESQQQVLRLRLVEDKAFHEISEQLKLPLGTVLSRMRLALEKLRSKLK